MALSVPSGNESPIQFDWLRQRRNRENEMRTKEPNRLKRNKCIYDRSSGNCVRWLRKNIEDLNRPRTRSYSELCDIVLIDGVAGAGKSFVLNLILDNINCIACGTTHTATNALPDKVTATTLHRAIGINCITLNTIKNIPGADLSPAIGEASRIVFRNCCHSLEEVTQRIMHESRRLIATATDCIRHWKRDRYERDSGDQVLTESIFHQLLLASMSDMSQRAWMLVNNIVVIDEAGQAPYYYLILLCLVWRELNRVCCTPQFLAKKDLIVIVVGSTSQSSAMHADATIDSIMDFCLSSTMKECIRHCKFLDNRRCIDDETADLMIALESGVVTKHNNPVSYAHAELAVRSREEMMDPSYEPYRI